MYGGNRDAMCDGFLFRSKYLLDESLRLLLSSCSSSAVTAVLHRLLIIALKPRPAPSNVDQHEGPVKDLFKFEQ